MPEGCPEHLTHILENGGLNGWKATQVNGCIRPGIHDWHRTRHLNVLDPGRPHRLVVRTSRCGRDNPGSTPGAVIF